MSFITESKKAYRQVEALEKETSDHEISMARGELEGIADKALATSAMLQGVTESGNPLPAWVQSKITNASDYITSVHDYLKYTPGMNESFNLEENTFEKIYQMQQDGKSTEDIAKELKLNPALVKKVLGENTIISEGLSDAQISQLKKEYEPLKGKTITTSQYQQLKNILFKLQDGDLEKLQKQNIPFASTGAGSILRVRKSPVKITSVKVPGLEGMAEEKIPQDYLDYLRTIVYKKVDFYEIPPKHIIQHWKDEPNKDRFKGKIIDYKEEVQLQEKPSRKKHVVFKLGDKLVAKDFRGYNDDEIAKSIDDFLKQNSKSIVVQQSPIQSVTEEPKNPYAIGMAAAMKATGDTPPLKKSTITKAHKIADKVKEEEVKGSFKEETSSDEAKKKGLEYYGFGRYGKDGTVTHITDGGKLKELPKSQQKSVDDKSTQDTKAKDKPKQDTKIDYSKEFNDVGLDDINVDDDGKNLSISKEFDPNIDSDDDVRDEYENIVKLLNKKGINYKSDPKNDIEYDDEYSQINFSVKKEEVSKEKETEFHKKLDTLVHKTFGKRKDEKMPVKESTSRNINEGAKALVEAIVALQKKADKTGMPYSILKQVYDRGMAAWKGGHRPGASQHQWAFARVNSFVTKSSGTWGGADSDLAKKVKGKE